MPAEPEALAGDLAPWTTSETDADRLRIRAVWLYFVEGRTQGEIAKVLGVNHNARRRAYLHVESPTDLARVVARHLGFGALA